MTFLRHKFQCVSLIILTLFSSDLWVANMPYYSHIIKEDLSPTPALQNLLSVMEIDPPKNYAELVQSTQKEWLRKSKERWQEEDRFADKKEQIKNALAKLGCLDKVEASKNHYNYAIILGATVYGTRPKIKQLVELHNKGVRFDHIVFLTADWPHDVEREQNALFNPKVQYYPFKKNWTKPATLPETEHDITHFLIEQTEFPKDLDPKKFIHIVSSNLTDKDGKPRRANTYDTLIDLTKEKNLENQSCLIFSLQPFVGYQESIARWALPASCNIESVGEPCDANISSAVLLDNMARWLYAEGKRRHIEF